MAGLNITDHGFDRPVFSKNRQQLLDADVARESLLETVGPARKPGLLSEERFSPTLEPSGTLLDTWASVQSFRPQDEDPPPESGGRNPQVDFRGEGAATRPINRLTSLINPPPIPMPGCPERARVRKRSCALAPTC